MLSSTLLVTIQGPFQTMDLELPGDVAIGELLPILFEISGSQAKSSQLPLLGHPQLYMSGLNIPLPLHETLIHVGVCNGTQLELRTQEWPRTSPASIEPQSSQRRSVQPEVPTGGIGVTWEPLF